MLYLGPADILEALPLDAVMDADDEALRIYEAGAYDMPERLVVPSGDRNLMLAMPCVAADHLTTKILTIYPGNPSQGRPMIQGVVLLADQATGDILALMDAQTLTAMRTGAVTGLSCRYLAKTDARSVGLVGCGTQGHYQVRYACAARDIDRVTLYDIRSEAIPSFVARLEEALPGVVIAVAESTVELLQASDIVITATTAQSPVFPDDPALFAGKHCVAIGSFQPDVREYPDAIFRASERVWVDLEFAMEESGELIAPLKSGILTEQRVETLGHLIVSGEPPIKGVNGTTFFKTVGMALFDLAAARLAYSRAVELGLGMRLE